MTQKLYQSHDTQYEDTALSFLVTEDGSTLVVLGKRYHYIFRDITPSLRTILGSPLRKVVIAYLSNFYVRRDNAVTGEYVLVLADNASREERRLAVDSGFVTPGLSLSGQLAGVRYSAEGFPVFSPTQQFNRPYVVNIREQEPGSALATKILLTPITVAADGALILGGLFLFLLVVFAGGVR